MVSSNINRCNSDNPDFVELNKIRQYCDNTGCLEGYEIVQGASSEAICNEYYPENKYNNINCCIPKFNTCNLTQSDMETINVIHKDKNNTYNVLNNNTISELKQEYETLSGNTISSDDLLNEENPKNFLIKEIIDIKPENQENNCINNINFI